MASRLRGGGSDWHQDANSTSRVRRYRYRDAERRRLRIELPAGRVQLIRRSGKSGMPGILGMAVSFAPSGPGDGPGDGPVRQLWFVAELQRLVAGRVDSGGMEPEVAAESGSTKARRWEETVGEPRYREIAW